MDPQPGESQLVDKFKDLLDTSAPRPPEEPLAGSSQYLSRSSFWPERFF